MIRRSEISQEYRDFNEVERSVEAQERCNVLIEVSQALAAHLDETVDAYAIKSDPRIKSLTVGWWANRYCLLYGFRTALEKVAVGTLERMSRAGVFRAPVSMSINEIFEQLPEIHRPRQENESKPVRKVRILGYDIAETDAEADLAKGVLASSHPVNLQHFSLNGPGN